MSEAEQLSPLLANRATKAAAAPRRSARLARAAVAIILALMLLNLALAAGYVAATGDTTAFFSHQLQLPFLAVIYAALGAAIVTRRPRNAIGPILLCVSFSYLLSAWSAGVPLYAALAPSFVPPVLSDVGQWMNNWIWLPAQILPITFVFLLFPDGHLLTPRWRVVGWAAGLGLLSLIVALAAHPGPVSDWGTRPNPFGISGAESALNRLLYVGSILLAVGFLGSMASLVVRFRRSIGIERAQMKWLAYAAVIILIVAVFAIPLQFFGRLTGPQAMEWSITVTNLAMLGVAAAATVAIVRYRLYDIDVIINRTLVYAIMTGVVLLIYGLVVGGAGLIFQAQGNTLFTILATALVAVLFQPIRSRLQQGVNRLLYGQRNEPFEVLALLGQRLEQTIPPDAVYPALVETVARALRLPYAAIDVWQDGRWRTVESFGRPADDPVAYDLTYQGQLVGRLRVARRSPEEAFSRADERLLLNVARQAGAAVYTAQLTADLQRSRQQLVTGREEERRRLRRDLHDGLGPSLASLLLQARVLRRMIRDDPPAAEALADEIQGDIRVTIDDIRRVVHELRPPALDDLGLVPALNVMALKIGRADAAQAVAPCVTIDAPDDLPSLPAAVEVAAFRIVQEALTNVIHHAQARTAIVRVWLERDLRLEIRDDGVGYRGERAGGLGVRSMRERAAELGGTCTVAALPLGGTVVRATLPVGG